ncbi:hypothetical protein ACIA5G_39745 [Amycolatopsis sp. NPDC051758]|uniref:hypothetical protein n=1 Tax=Amycolatopsis sp. NPDC051758 TaxID=3363935 RepID=UPI0037BCFECD
MSHPGEPSAVTPSATDLLANLSAEMQIREYRDAVVIAENDVKVAYEQIRSAGKTALAKLTALGFLGTAAAFSLPYLPPAHLIGASLAVLFAALFAVCFVIAVRTIRSNIPPRGEITEANTGWLIGVVLTPAELVQHFRDRANSRLEVAAAELAILAPLGHHKHRRNGLLGDLLIADLITGLLAFAFLRLGI